MVDLGRAVKKLAQLVRAITDESANRKQADELRRALPLWMR